MINTVDCMYETYTFGSLGSLAVNVAACHAGDPGSIPGVACSEIYFSGFSSLRPVRTLKGGRCRL